MRAIIIANGKISNTDILNKYIKKEDIIICCDGGCKYAFAEGILPKYIIGDLDSSSEQIIDFYKTKGVILKKLDKEKDESDLEVCIDFAISLKALEILILGAIGDRFDHTLANVNLLKKALDNNIKATIIDENNEIQLINSEAKIFGKKGDTVSLIPLSTNVFSVTTENLLYPLKDYNMQIGYSLGISNVMLNDSAKVFLKEGYLLIIKSKD